MDSEGRRITSAVNTVPRSINFRKELYVVIVDVTEVVVVVVDSSFGSTDRRRFFDAAEGTCCICEEDDDGAGGELDTISGRDDEDLSRTERRIII